MLPMSEQLPFLPKKPDYGGMLDNLGLLALKFARQSPWMVRKGRMRLQFPQKQIV